MDIKTKKRLEDVFGAELILKRVYLHLQQCETANMEAIFLVAVRHQEITDEARRLQRESRLVATKN